MVDFSAFDDKVDLAALQEEVTNAPDDFGDVPDGSYIVSVEKMELALTKEEQKPMFAVQFKIVDGDQKGRMIFFNRVIGGNKTSDRWNDGKAIKSVITWLEKLETSTVPEFVNYSDFADCIIDIFQEIQGKAELEVDYAAKKFNPVRIIEVYDI